MKIIFLIAISLFLMGCAETQTRRYQVDTKPGIPACVWNGNCGAVAKN